MNWLKRMFSPRTTTAPPQTPAKPVRIASDASYAENRNILDGVEFIATLHVTTPYAVLIHHGEVFGGAPSKAPQYGDQSQGIWVPKTKSWKSLGIDLPDLPPSQHATDIGLQQPMAYLPFLLNFRRIFESDRTDEHKIEELRKLAAQTPAYSEFWSCHLAMHEDFPRNLFYRSFLDLPGVGRKTAQALYGAGFRSVEQIQRAKPPELRMVPGVGPALVKKLLSTVPQEHSK